MSNAVQGVYYCNQYRTLQLSNRMYERNVPGVPLQMNYDTRPVDTKFKVFPILLIKIRFIFESMFFLSAFINFIKFLKSFFLK